MLENFWFNVEYGINHVLDINAYDHVLFLISLTVPYVFKDWKRVLILVSDRNEFFGNICMCLFLYNCKKYQFKH